MLKGLHDVPIIFGRGKKISVVFVSQGIGHTSHHLLIGSLHLRSEFLDGSLSASFPDGFYTRHLKCTTTTNSFVG